MRALLFIFCILQFMIISCKKESSEEEVPVNNTTPTSNKIA